MPTRWNRGASLKLGYLTYSPDFKTIDNALAKLTAIPRKAAARTIDGLRATIGRGRAVRSAADPASEFVFDMDPDDVLE